MSTLPPIPPVADADRTVTYAPGGASTTLVDIPFPVYGDATDIAVYADGQLLGSGFYGLVSKSGTGIDALPRPLTDAQVRFEPPITPTVLEIKGAIRPRQTTMATAAQIARREFNQALGYILSIARELYAKSSETAFVLKPDASGPLSSRPLATSVDTGYIYLQTDDASGRIVYYVSNGAAWSSALYATGPTGATGAKGADGAPGAVSASVASLRNRLINGSFSVNQERYVSGVALAAGVYGHDGWKAGGSGCTYTFSQTYPDTTITITAGSLKQIIEDKNVEGGSYVLTWTGTAVGSINGAAAGASPQTVTGVSAGGSLYVEFSGGTLGKVQIEPGTTASDFERRPMSVEMTLCQRFLRFVPISLSGQTGGGYRNAVPISFPKMRTTPSVSAASADPNLAQATLNVTSYGVDSATDESAACFAVATISGAFSVAGYRAKLDARP